MKFLLIVILALVALTKAKRDLSKLSPVSRQVWTKRLPKVPITRIVNGEEAKPHQFPHQVILFINGKGVCGGSILNERKILTAAHCCYDAFSIEVVAGAHNVQQSEETQQSIISSNIKVHEDYDPEILANDVCVITLPRDLKLDGVTAAAIELYDGDDNLEETNATVSGWGRPSDSSTTISPVLRFTSNPIITNDECKKYYSIVRNSTICLSGTDGRSACRGDSGGPLVALIDGSLKEIGIVSFGSSFGCSVGIPSAYARVSSFAEWIRSA